MVTISDNLAIMRPRVTRLGIARSMTVEDNIFSVLGAYFRILSTFYNLFSENFAENFLKFSEIILKRTFLGW